VRDTGLPSVTLPPGRALRAAFVTASRAVASHPAPRRGKAVTPLQAGHRARAVTAAAVVLP